MALWSSPEEAWRGALDSYPSIIDRLSATKAAKATRKPSPTHTLTALDAFYTSDLPPLATNQGHLTSDQLSRLTTWKLVRGKFRPRLQALADSNTDAAVRASTARAANAKPAALMGSAMDALEELKGVGPATASAILALWHPRAVAFLSDEAMVQVPALGGKREYTRKAVRVFCGELVEKSAALNRGAGEVEWTPVLCERALFASFHAEAKVEARPARKKRKR